MQRYRVIGVQHDVSDLDKLAGRKATAWHEELAAVQASRQNVGDVVALHDGKFMYFFMVTFMMNVITARKLCLRYHQSQMQRRELEMLGLALPLMWISVHLLNDLSPNWCAV